MNPQCLFRQWYDDIVAARSYIGPMVPAGGPEPDDAVPDSALPDSPADPVDGAPQSGFDRMRED
jgi:hypothetical protein